MSTQGEKHRQGAAMSCSAAWAVKARETRATLAKPLFPPRARGYRRRYFKLDLRADRLRAMLKRSAALNG